MKLSKSSILMFLIFGILITLAACGGGGGGSSSGTSSSGTGGSSSKTLSGTAATGKALANVAIHLKDSTGTVVSTTADADGKFSFDTSSLTPPFYLRTQGYGLFSSTDQESGTANLTPLSTALVGIANNGDSDIFTNPPANLDLNAASTALKDFLTPVMEKYGVTGADFISTAFDADGQGLDALLDSIYISIDSTNKTIEIKNPFTGQTIGTATLSNGTVSVTDSVEQTEADSLPQTVTNKKYFGYLQDLQDSYGNPPHGPSLIDMVDDGNGTLSVTITATEGDTGDLFLIYGTGTINGNDISFTLPVILCSDTDPDGTGTAVFTGTVDSNGNVSGTFTNTLSAGDTCKENNSYIYEGTFTAEDVTAATSANMAGTYDFYFTPEEYTEEGPVTMDITQNSNVINVSFNTGTVVYSGQGIVYGNYLVFRVPVILCHDTDANAEAEYATLLGKFDSQTNTITGVYGDGVPAGDHCKAPDYDTTQRTVSAQGSWRAQ